MISMQRCKLGKPVRVAGDDCASSAQSRRGSIAGAAADDHPKMIWNKSSGDQAYTTKTSITNRIVSWVTQAFGK